MYWYYFQATRKIEVSWKAYLTQMQISQLFSFIALGVWIHFFAEEVNFRPIGTINGLYAVTLWLLFLQFYKSAYSGSKGKKGSATSSASGSSTSSAARKQD